MKAPKVHYGQVTRADGHLLYEVSPLIDQPTVKVNVYPLESGHYSSEGYFNIETYTPAWTLHLGEVELFNSDNTPIRCSPLHDDENWQLHALAAIICFCTMRPGDVDEDYFENYNEAQLNFAQSYLCESLQESVSYDESD